MRSIVSTAYAAVAAIAVTFAVNTAGYWWLRATDFDSHSFYDGCCAILTLAAPAVAGGIVAAIFARRNYGPASACAFALFSIAGFIHPCWHIPTVSPESAQSPGMHYFLYNPLVTLPFGMAAAWAAGQLTTGKWKLEDDKPVLPD
jgi:hypothetical protein